MYPSRYNTRDPSCATGAPAAPTSGAPEPRRITTAAPMVASGASAATAASADVRDDRARESSRRSDDDSSTSWAIVGAIAIVLGGALCGGANDQPND